MALWWNAVLPPCPVSSPDGGLCQAHTHISITPINPQPAGTLSPTPCWRWPTHYVCPFSTGFWHSLFSCDIHKHFPPLVLADDNQGPLPTLGPCGVQERCGFHNKVPCEHVKGQSNSRLSLSCSTKEKRRSTAWKRQSRTKSKTRERS